MRVKDLMTSTVHVCHERDMLDRPAQIMWDHDCGCVPVVNDDGRIVGMITDRDICMAAHFRGQPITMIPVGTVMARELCTCQPDDQLIDAERLMSSRQVRRLPVVHPDGSLAGILSISDIARRRPRRGGDGARQRTGWNAEIIETISAIWEPRHREPESGVVEDAKKAPARRRLRPPKTEADSEQPQERRHRRPRCYNAARVAFYRTFSEKQLTAQGAARRGRIEQARFAMASHGLARTLDMLEVGPGQGAIADLAREAGHRYRAVEPSPVLVQHLRARGIEVVEAFTPPIPAADESLDLVYADQVLEHMAGIDAARSWVAEARRILRPGGRLFVVVPDYLKERGFFWDIDYTHNFVTTERRMRQLLYDGGFDIDRVVRSIGRATGPARDLLAAAALVANIPGLDALSRYTKTEELLYKVRKNLFETLAFVATKGKAS